MTAKEFPHVIQQAEDYNSAMTTLIEKYGELLLAESQPESEESQDELWSFVEDFICAQPNDYVTGATIKRLQAGFRITKTTDQ